MLCVKRSGISPEITRFFRNHFLLTALVLYLALPVLLTPVLFHASAAKASDWKGKEVVEEGTLHVINPSEPVQPDQKYELKELWRLGGETDNDDEFFGLISRIITDADGNVYLLDTQLSEVKVFSPQGEYLRTIGRAGEGPGEFRIPTGLFMTPDGNIGVLQVAPGKIVLLTKEGEPAGEFPLPKTEDGGFLILRNGQSRSNNLVLSVSKNSFEQGRFDQKQYLCSLNKDGSERARYLEETLTIDFANPVMDDSKWNNFNNRWAVGTDGRVYAAPEYLKYSISVWNADGKLDRIIERPYEPSKRNQKELDLVNNIMEAVSRQVPNAKIKVSEYNSDIEQIHTREDGSLWVVSSEGSRKKPDNSLAVFDIFDSKGHYIRKVTLMGQGNPQMDGYYFVGDRLYVVTDLLQASLALQSGGQAIDLGTEEAKPMEVICYQLPKDLQLTGN